MTIKMNLGDRDLRASDYTLEIIKHAVPAIFIGLVLDKILKKVQEKYKINEFIMIVMQINIGDHSFHNSKIFVC
jgi:undecaprenyl pyrophosphate phosphatase UppP